MQMKSSEWEFPVDSKLLNKCTRTERQVEGAPGIGADVLLRKLTFYPPTQIRRGRGVKEEPRPHWSQAEG